MLAIRMWITDQGCKSGGTDVIVRCIIIIKSLPIFLLPTMIVFNTQSAGFHLKVGKKIKIPT